MEISFCGFLSNYHCLKTVTYKHHHVSVMELVHLLTRSDLTHPEVSSKVCHDSFCQSGSSVSLPWVIYCEAFYLYILSIFSCNPVICPKLVLFLTPLQFVYLFVIYNQRVFTGMLRDCTEKFKIL